MKKEFISTSATATAEIGQRLGQAISKKTVVAFKGGLGAGKTCFTSGLAKGLGYNGDVTSPTFALINEYFGGRLPIYHFDMYRISDEDELYSIGFYDYYDQEAVIVAEWSENIEAALDGNHITVEIEGMGDNPRKITVTALDDNIIKEL
ncbi:MAG: tRNA (adenosine(37)-N6)-threonylcarbamoyltransferase complex ATPase subunit type 1 TsaE [Clostridia bacterium]|nr:tRNA (adenosine(37)-N6)-threonylcarbamoyltransferase complex ATPase subunit type 1 TsaE [Clostridia bacterium]